MVGAKNKNVAVMRLDEIVTELVDKDLISGVNGAARDNFATMIPVARRNMKISSQRFRRRVDQKILMLANDAREGKEEQEFLRHDLYDLVVLLRNDVDVIATEDNKFCNLPKNVWRGSCAG